MLSTLTRVVQEHYIGWDHFNGLNIFMESPMIVMETTLNQCFFYKE